MFYADFGLCPNSVIITTLKCRKRKLVKLQTTCTYIQMMRLKIKNLFWTVTVFTLVFELLAFFSHFKSISVLIDYFICKLYHRPEKKHVTRLSMLLQLATGKLFSGIHCNISRLFVPKGVTAIIQPYNGTGGGKVDITAKVS